MEETTKNAVPQPEEAVLLETMDQEILSDAFPQDAPSEAFDSDIWGTDPNTPVWVADIHFRNSSKVYFFDPGELSLSAGDHVIIDTARGIEFGFCAAGNHSVRLGDIVAPLRKVLRIATEQDEKTAAENREKESHAFQVCQQKILDHHLDMQLVSAEYAFDGSKILFFFTADGRVDFRELVKDLASVFRTRIELRQIGVRDKAKMVGGLGICGRPFCCGEFLDDFQPVSIKMAKTQNLSLNPTKISGTCGRLMCCLKYEQEAYEDLLKTSPKPESFVDTPDGRGTVTEVNLLRQSVKVRMEDQPDTIGCYRNCDICILRNGKAKKNSPPIPKDLAPISSKPKSEQSLPEPKFLEKDPQKADFFVFSQEETVNLIVEEEPISQAENEAGEKKETAVRRSRRSRRRGSSARSNKPEGATEAEKKPSAHVSGHKAARPESHGTASPSAGNGGAAPGSGDGKAHRHHRPRRRPKKTASGTEGSKE